MYVYYVLRGAVNQQPAEFEGDVDDEQFPNVDRTEGIDIIHAVINKLAEEGKQGEWTECDLTNEYYDRDDTYVFFNKKWIRRSDIPLTNTR